MTRLAAAALLPLWLGATLVLSELRWFAPTALADRLRPFSPTGSSAQRNDALSAASLKDALLPLAISVGEGAARLRRGEALAPRLARARSPVDAPAFRARQAGHACAALLVALVATRAVGLGVLPSLVAVVVLPAAAHQRLEWQLSAACRARQERLRQELPPFAEHLSMLLGSGWSLGGALQRVARRGGGVVSREMEDVLAQIGRGVSDTGALREWADGSGLEDLDRLVSVLELNRVTADLGRLLAAETRSMREQRHRRLIEELERRAQQVWIPVTVATLVPGSLFLAIPFVEALRLFTAP